MTSLKLLDKCQGRDSNPDYSISRPLSFYYHINSGHIVLGDIFYFLLIHQHFGFAGYSAGIGVHHENDVECQTQWHEIKTNEKDIFTTVPKKYFSLEIWFSGATNKLLFVYQILPWKFYKS